MARFYCWDDFFIQERGFDDTNGAAICVALQEDNVGGVSATHA
jgi:hypothetical protein